MKKKMIQYILLATAASTLLSCSKDDKIFTDTKITVSPPEGVEMLRFQATMSFLNINTLQTVSSSDFENGVLHIRLLKGVYRLSLEEGGGILTRDSSGKTVFREAVIDGTPEELTEDSETAVVKLILK